MRFWQTKPHEPQQEDAPALSPYAAAWPFTPESPAITGFTRTDQKLAVMLVDVTHLDWPQIEPLLPVAREAAIERNMVPVLIVDLVDFTGLRKTDFAYDVLPNAAANVPFQPSLDWPAYVARRRALLTEKWRPAAIVHLSQQAEGWT